MLRLTAFLSVVLYLAAECRSDFIDWSEVPEHVSADLETFSALFHQAHSDGIGISILGDSQETVAGGGRHYIPALGHGFFEKYGNVPKSGIAGSSSYSYRWMLSGSNVGVVSQASAGLPSTQVGTFDSRPYGLLAQFVTDNSNEVNLPSPANGYFNGHPVQIEVIARQKENSSQMSWRVNLQDNDSKTYFGGTNLATGTTNVDLQSSPGEFVTIDLGTFELGNHSAIQAILRGESADSSVDIAGVRFKNAGDPSGIAVQSFSAGGYRASSFLNNHPDGEQAFKVFAKDDIVAIQFGANDSGGVSAEQFGSNLEAIIERVREWTGDPTLPIILIGDPDRVIANPSHRIEFDQFPAVAAEIALNYENVLALNTRLLGAQHGWEEGSQMFTDYDNVLNIALI